VGTWRGGGSGGRRRGRDPFAAKWHSNSMPRYTGIAVLVVAAALVGRLAWQGTHYILHPEQRRAVLGLVAPSSGSDAHVFAPWENDAIISLEAGAQDSGAGKMMAAEMDVDRAGSIVTTMRLQSRPASPPFFDASISALDRVMQGHADDERMMEHVTEVRAALAELRSSTNAGDNSQPAADPATAAKRISIGAPRVLAIDSTLDPATLHGNYLDATLMPDSSEILLPPESRAFADGVRVENLTIAGASQTLDGVRWRNVTFVGTRLRYEGGALDLRDVHFVNCRFGVTSDERGARLATVVALGESSITIDAPAPKPAP
jgi:hypothetical protein